MLELAPIAWAALGVAALFVGISKTALPGSNTLAIAVFATVLPARTSTGAMLVLFMVGDLFAILTYRRHAHWPTIFRLIPAVAVGLILGYLFLAHSDDSIVRRAIGVILLAMIALTLIQRRRTLDAGPQSRTTKNVLSAGYGTAGGFSTMVANAGGPVMSLYFLASRTEMKVFLGTTAWFFTMINIVKLPFMVQLGLINQHVLLMDLMLVPLVIAGAFIGRWLISRLNQALFDKIVLTLTVAGAVYLLI